MKRICSGLLAIIIMFSAIVVDAATGDVIHIGSQKLFSVNSKTQADDILKGIESGLDEEGFYRVVETKEGKQYINIVKTEKEQMEHLLSEFAKAGVNVNDSEAVNGYLSKNPGIATKLDEIEKNNTHEFSQIPGIGGQSESIYYGGDLKPSLIEGTHYSVPEPGSNDGTTKVKTLKLPEGSYSWKIKLMDEEEKGIKINDELKEADGYKSYNADTNINPEGKKFLGIYSVTTEQKVKAFASIELKPEMIKKPREKAEELQDLESLAINKVENAANTVKITGIPAVPEADKDKHEFKSILKNNKTVIYKDEKFEKKDFIQDTTNIKVLEDTEIIETFTKYIYLLKLSKDENPKVLGYKELLVTQNDINHTAPKLMESKYTGPIKGSTDGSTKFTKLDGTFKYIIADKVNIPIKDADYLSLGTSITAGTEIKPTEDQKTLIGKEMLLVSLDENKVQAYAKFNLTTENVQGQKALDLIEKDGDNEYHYTKPIKGSKESTTQIKETHIRNLGDGTKFMYEILDGTIEKIMIGEVRPNAEDLVLGEDINVSSEKGLLILATDKDGKAKAYKIIKLTTEMIRDPKADELEFSVHYEDPIKGSTPGTIKFNHLKYNDSKFYYKVSDEEMETPEMGSGLPTDLNENTIKIESGSKTEDIIIVEETDPILKNENGFKKNIIVYAVDKGTKNILAYKKFILNETNIKLPKADSLLPENYGNLSPGTLKNTTMISKLNKNNLAGSSNYEYKYKIVPETIEVDINQKISGTQKLEENTNLFQAKAEHHLLILLVDSGNRTKYYATLTLTNKNVRGEDAGGLKTPQHYSEPTPGSENNSTKFDHTGFGVGTDKIKDATQFMVQKSDKSFGKIEIDKVLTGSVDYTKGSNIEGVDEVKNKYLVLLATDESGNVKAYKEFTLAKKNIRGGNALEIPESNYSLGVGTQPSTTKFIELEKHNFSSSVTWLYKWSEDDKFSPEMPYLNQIIEDKEFKTYTKGNDIVVNKVKDKSEEPKYGYILLYAVLNGREVQGYRSIPVNSNMVKEHADELVGVELTKDGVTKTDHTKISGLSDGKKYKYIISEKSLGIPAKGENIDIVAKDANDVTSAELLVSLGQYITVYEVDSNKKIQGYKELIVESANIKQGSAKFVGISEKEEIEVLEGQLNNGSYEIKIELEDATWSNDLLTVEKTRNALFDSFIVDKESENWNKVISKLKETGRYGLKIEGKFLTITTTKTDTYDINEEQRITLKIPAIALEKANNPITVKGTIVVKPTVGASISGSIISKNRQSDIRSGDTTIIVKLVDGAFKSWVNDDNKKSLINGFKGDGENWIKIVPEGLANIDLSKFKVESQGPQEVKLTILSNNVDFGTKSETITLTIPKDIIEDGRNDIVATPKFEIRPDILRVEGKIKEEESNVEVEAPLYRNIITNKDKLTIDLSVGTIKDGFSINDLEIAGLSGLKATARKVSDKQIEINLSGMSTTTIPEEGKELEITIKGSAIEEENSLDSAPIIENAKIKRQAGQDDMISALGKVTIDVAEGELKGFNKETMRYSLDSKNGTDGEWVSDVSSLKTSGFKAGKVYIKSSENPKIFRLLADLKSDRAPIGIKVGEVNYTTEKITIDGTETGSYEYSINGGLDWEELSNPITISENIKDLRVRIASTKDKLYSLPTASLKFEDLSKVKMNVQTKELTDTTLGMQYKFGDNDPTLKPASNGITKNVLFEAGEIIVFEKNNPKNSRVVGNVKEGSTVGQEELTFDISLGKVEGTGLEFTITTLIPDKYNTIKDTEWKEPAESGIEFKQGTLILRRKATEDTLASLIVLNAEIFPAADAPELQVDNFNKVIKYGEEILGTTSVLEYRIGTSKDWKNSSKWASPNGDQEKYKDQDVTIYVRVKAITTQLPSKEAKVDLTANVNLDGVSLNLAEGLLENTTSRMEYSFNSTDGIDGEWRLASNGNTNIITIDKLDELEGKIIWIRQNKNEQQNRLITETVKGSKVKQPIKRNELAEKERIEIDYKEKTITNLSDHDLEVKIGSGKWTTIPKETSKNKLININFVSGEDIIYRTKATRDKIYSDFALLTMVPFPGETPYVDYDDNDNKITVIKSGEEGNILNSGYEFKEKTRENWLDVKVGDLGNKVFLGDVVVQIRKSATKDSVPSSIKEITFTKDINMANVKFDKYGNPPQLLNTEPEMEYQIFFKGQEPPKEWKKTIKGNTPLKEISNVNDVILILIRDARTKEEHIKPVYGEIDKRPVNLEDIKYEIKAEGKIIFTGITEKMQYKESKDSNWLEGVDTGKVEYSILEPVEILIRDKNYPTKTRTIKVDTRAEVPKINILNYVYQENGTISITLSGFDKDKMEYSIDGGTNYLTFPNSISTFNIAKNHKFLIRSKAIETKEGEAGKLPSLPTPQLNGIYLGEVGINPMEQKIEGTTGEMQYSLDSTDGKNGTWKGAGTPDTKTPEFSEGMTVWIRQTNKTINARRLMEKTVRETAPGTDYIIYDILNGTIKNNSYIDLKYRISGGKWIELPAEQTASSVGFKAGDLHILSKGKGNTLDSDPVLVANIIAEASAPIVEINDVKNKVIKINTITDFSNFSNFEYKLPANTNWIDGSFLSGEEFVGKVTVQIRKKATSAQLPSQFTSVDFTELDLRKVGLSKHVETYELNGTTTGMEYRLTIDGVEMDWIICDDKNTKLFYTPSVGIKTPVNNSTDITKIEIRKKDNESQSEFVTITP